MASVWANTQFRRLWFAQAISKLGSAVTATALPLTAVLLLHADAADMALLVFAGQLPDLLFGLLAGVWVDRMRRRPILVGSDLARFVLLSTVPIAAAFGVLTFTQLWLVSFAVGIFTLFFAVANVAVLPSIVRPDELVDANSRLSITDAIVGLSGPSAGGALVQFITAPRAILADALSYLASAAFLRRIGRTERRPSRRQGSSIRVEVLEGVRELVRSPVLRSLAISTGIGALAVAMQTTVVMLYLVRTLDLSPVLIGVVSTMNGAGALLGASLAKVAGRFGGIGRVIILGSLVFDLAAFAVPAASYTTVPLPILFAGQVFSGAGYAVYQINQVSLRQVVTPARLLGRVTAARRFLIFCMAPAGAAIGGFLGSSVSYPATLMLGAVLAVIGTAVLVASPLWHVTDLSSWTASPNPQGP